MRALKKNVAFVTRGFRTLKRSCDICDNDYLALPKNISHGPVAIVTRGFERFEKNFVTLVTTILHLCGYVGKGLVAAVTRNFESSLRSKTKSCLEG